MTAFTVRFKPSRRFTRAKHVVVFPGGAEVDLDRLTRHDVPDEVLASYRNVTADRMYRAAAQGEPYRTRGITWMATTPKHAAQALYLADGVLPKHARVWVLDVRGLPLELEPGYDFVGFLQDLAAQLPARAPKEGSRSAWAGLWEQRAAGEALALASQGLLPESRLYRGSVPLARRRLITARRGSANERPATATETTEAAGWEGANDPDVAASDLDWFFVESYPTDRLEGLMPGGDWRGWWADEKKYGGDYYEWLEAMWEQTRRRDPIIVIEDTDGDAEGIWDGWHRTALSILHDLPLPALVGRPRSARGLPNHPVGKARRHIQGGAAARAVRMARLLLEDRHTRSSLKDAGYPTRQVSRYIKYMIQAGLPVRRSEAAGPIPSQWWISRTAELQPASEDLGKPARTLRLMWLMQDRDWTVRQVAAWAGVSQKGAWRMLASMEAGGVFLERSQHTSIGKWRGRGLYRTHL